MKLKAIDLFSGIGGFRWALMKAIPNSEVVFSSEIDEKACETYKLNFKEFPKGDITKISVSRIPDHDLLMAGFPCQAFSIAGISKLQSLDRWVGFKNPEKGNLFFEIARILEAKKPKAFLLENVPNLKTHDNGKTFEIIKHTLRALGYEIYWKVLDSRHFGLPQMRKRIFIVGFRNKLRFSFQRGNPNLIPRVSSILENKVLKRFTLTDNTWRRFREVKLRHQKRGKGFGYQMVDLKGSAYTVTSHYYKDPHDNLIPQNGQNPRKFTPREFARLQGFTDEFKIHSVETHAYKQIGNSIPIPVVVEILKKIKDSLEKKKKRINIDTFFSIKPKIKKTIRN